MAHSDASSDEAYQAPDEAYQASGYQHAAFSAINEVPSLPIEFSEGVLIADKYKVVRHLGSGATGDVYLVENPVGLKEALKLLPSGLAESSHARDILIHELSLLRNLHHENVMGVYDIDFLPNTERVYFTSEYQTDHNLYDVFQKARASDQRLRPEFVLVWMSDVAKALAYIHGKGVVHGDIKPNNMLLDKKGRIKLCDFGFAYRLLPERGDSIPSRHQMEVGGTIMFASPEQRDQLMHQIDTMVGASSDVYSFGATLSFLLSGGFPDPGSPSAVDVLNRRVTDRINKFIAACCKNNPEERYADGSALRKAYLELLQYIARQDNSFFSGDLDAFVKELSEADGSLSNITLERDFFPQDLLESRESPIWHRALLGVLLILSLGLAELNFNLLGLRSAESPPAVGAAATGHPSVPAAGTSRAELIEARRRQRAASGRDASDVNLVGDRPEHAVENPSSRREGRDAEPPHEQGSKPSDGSETAVAAGDRHETQAKPARDGSTAGDGEDAAASTKSVAEEQQAAGEPDGPEPTSTGLDGDATGSVAGNGRESAAPDSGVEDVKPETAEPAVETVPATSATTPEPAPRERERPAGRRYIALTDGRLMAYLVGLHDQNGDGGLDVEEAKAITRLDLSREKGIRSLGGLDQLQQLEFLICANLGLTRLPDLPPRLRYLDCSGNQLTELPQKWPRFLMYLNCSNNRISQIDWLPEYLETLNVANNQLRGLPMLPEPLKTLHCQGNYFEKGRNWAREWLCQAN
ncbi:serine/threonine-protein kinase [Acanthopleuribacter pedis]|uniref:mitogen-activated protein kinase kinase n=1 Tax=Acanthopleuribacter pedis TaxID=442870 RepID=A0A8J7QBW6_9BACT|nr:serine/threonine-protein kinase [Acanthopleuribacter pedis]MBO1320869.1 protein kinase [Acanthopleuribacter pedis]